MSDQPETPAPVDPNGNQPTDDATRAAEGEGRDLHLDDGSLPADEEFVRCLGPEVPGFVPTHEELVVLAKFHVNEAIATQYATVFDDCFMWREYSEGGLRWSRLKTISRLLGDAVTKRIADEIGKDWTDRIEQYRASPKLPNGRAVHAKSTTAEVARLLHVDEATLHELIQRGEIKTPPLAPPKYCWTPANVASAYNALSPGKLTAEDLARFDTRLPGETEAS